MGGFTLPVTGGLLNTSIDAKRHSGIKCTQMIKWNASQIFIISVAPFKLSNIPIIDVWQGPKTSFFLKILHIAVQSRITYSETNPGISKFTTN